MLMFEHTITTKAKLETIWNLYSDITSWMTWDEGIEYASLDGPFVTGTRGILQPKGQDRLSFQLTEVQPMFGFLEVTDIPDAGIEIRFSHRLQKTLDGTSLTHTVAITGPNAEIFGEEFIAELSQGIPRTMERIAAMAMETEREHAS
jgi:hypothetical protein